MSDARLRRLERRAHEGDPSARQQLLDEERRLTGQPFALDHVRWGWGDVANYQGDVANYQGRGAGSWYNLRWLFGALGKVKRRFLFASVELFLVEPPGGESNMGDWVELHPHAVTVNEHPQ